METLAKLTSDLLEKQAARQEKALGWRERRERKSAQEAQEELAKQKALALLAAKMQEGLPNGVSDYTRNSARPADADLE